MNPADTAIQVEDPDYFECEDLPFEASSFWNRPGTSQSQEGGSTKPRSANPDVKQNYEKYEIILIDDHRDIACGCWMQ